MNNPKITKLSIAIIISCQSLFAQQAELVLQTAHTGLITSVDYSRDGKYVLTGSMDGTAKMWDSSTGLLIHTFNSDMGMSSYVAFSPDSRFVLTGGNATGSVKMWEVSSGKIVRTFKEDYRNFREFFSPAKPIAFSSDGRYVLIGSHDKSIWLWDSISGTKIRNFRGHSEIVYSAVFSPDSRHVATGSLDGTAKLWNVETGEEEFTFRNPSAINSVAFSPDGRFLLTGDAHGRVKLWNITTRRKIRTYEGQISEINSVAFSFDGRYVIAGGMFEIKLWNTTTGEKLRTLTKSANPSLSSNVTISPYARYVLTSSIEGPPKLLDISTGKEVRTFNGLLVSNPHCSIFSSDGRRILAGYEDGTAKLWDISACRMSRVFDGHSGPVTSVAFGPNNLLAVTGSKDKTARLWDAYSGIELRILEGHSGDVLAVAFSPDGQHVLTGSYDKTAKLWDASDAKEIRSFEGHSSPINSVSFSHDGQYALTGSMDGTARLWETFSGREIRTFHGHVYGIYMAVFSPDGQYILTGSKDKTAKLWDTSTGEEIHTFQENTGFVRSVAFSPDGRYLLTARYNIAILYDAETGEQLRKLRGHLKNIYSVAFSPDSRHIVSCSEDGTIRLWDTQTGNKIASLIEVNRKEYIIVLPDKYYKASKRGLKVIATRVGNKVFPFDQFDLKLNRPDIVLERLGKASAELIAAYNSVYQRRLKKMELSEEVLSSDYHLPKVTLFSQDIPLMTNSRSLSLKIKADDSKHFLKQLNVYINDVPIYGSKGITLTSKKLHTVIQDIEVTLSRGDNRIQVSVLNEKGVESLRETISVLFDGPLTKPDLFMIAIGVSEYQDSLLNLGYAASDAKKFGSVFAKKEGNYFEKVNIEFLLDANATKEKIVKAKKIFHESRVDDIAIVFLAGHGLVDSKGNYYFGTYDVNPINPQLRGLPYEKIEGLLDGIPARKKILFLDTCFSGEIEKPEIQVAQIDLEDLGMHGKIRKRSFSRGIAVTKRMLKTAVMIQQDMFVDLRRSTGAIVISSSAGSEFSVEDAKLQAGVFTYAVIEGLEQKTADKNKDEQIQISELQSYVLNEVKKMTNGEQHPTVRQENLIKDFAIIDWLGIWVEHGLPKFGGYPEILTAVSFSKDNRYLFSGSSNGTVKLWSTVTGKEVGSFQILSEPIQSIAVSSDGSYLLVKGLSWRTKLWDVGSAREVQSFQKHGYFVIGIAFNQNRPVAITRSFYDRTVCLWDVSVGEKIMTFKGPWDSINEVRVSRNGNHVFAWCTDGTFIIWDTNTRK